MAEARTQARISAIWLALSLAVGVGCAKSEGILLRIAEAPASSSASVTSADGGATLADGAGASADGGALNTDGGNSGRIGAVDQLKIYLAYDSATDGGVNQWVQDRRTPAADIALGGRDLASSPYDLLLHEDDHEGDHRAITAAAVAYRNGAIVGYGILPEPAQPFASGKVVVRTLTLVPFTTASPPIVTTATGCIEILGRRFVSATDHDCDSFTPPDDCNDWNANVKPGVSEVCSNQLDDNCNGATDETTDADQDGQTNCDGDCDDSNRAIYLGAREGCDGLDNDCDGSCDEQSDQDGDLYTTCGTIRNAAGKCANATPMTANEDCADSVATIHPGATESCNGRDDDCDGNCDDSFDQDDDGYSSCGFDRLTCDGISHPEVTDCNDQNPAIHPGAEEICDGADNNCDGAAAANSEACYFVFAGICGYGTRTCDDTPGGAGLGGVCNPQSGLTALPTALCTKYGTCAASSTPLLCVERELIMEQTFRVLRCQVDFTHSAQFELCAAAREAITNPPQGPMCTWSISRGIPTGEFSVGFLRNGAASSSTNECAATFLVSRYGDPQNRPAETRILLVSEHNGPGTSPEYVYVDLIPNIVASCSGDGLRCSEL